MGEPVAAAPAEQKPGKKNPFGDAKPVDTQSKLLALESRDPRRTGAPHRPNNSDTAPSSGPHAGGPSADGGEQHAAGQATTHAEATRGPAPAHKARSNPFGDAKPVDTQSKTLAIEQRLQQGSAAHEHHHRRGPRKPSAGAESRTDATTPSPPPDGNRGGADDAESPTDRDGQPAAQPADNAASDRDAAL